MRTRLINRTNTFLIALLFLSGAHKAQGQQDSLRLAQLIKQTNDIFLYGSAQGTLLSPYEIRQHNRDQFIKNIEWVDGFVVHKKTSSKEYSVIYVVKDNQTIVQNPDDRFNSRTYSYYPDGRIHKIYRGKHINDQYLNDKKGFLIQHGSGGELKKAKRKDKVFEWRNVKYNRVEYITSFDREDRLSSIRQMGHYFGPGVEYEMEEYKWEGKRLLSKNTIMTYKKGGVDTTFATFHYDSLGLIATINSRTEDQRRWSTNQLDTEIEYLENEQIKISISQGDMLLLAFTFDHYDNIVEMHKPSIHQRMVIEYRSRERRK
jgi:hypothetical protein